MLLDPRPPSETALPLPAVLDLRAARPLADAILARRGEDLDLDGSEVTRLGGLCLQVLLASEAEWRAAGRRLALVNASPALVEALGRLGAHPVAA